VVRVCLDVSYTVFVKDTLSLRVYEKVESVRIDGKNPVVCRPTIKVKIFVLLEAVYSGLPE
jgi:hypothetical protein